MRGRAGGDVGRDRPGFLEAMTSDDTDFAVARKYLSPETSKRWRPDAGTTVLTRRRTTGQRAGAGRTRASTIRSSASRSRRWTRSMPIRRLHPPVRTDIHLSLQSGPDGKEWRIDDLPPGLVLGASDFQRNYRSVNKYYFASAPRRNVVGGSGLHPAADDPGRPGWIRSRRRSRRCLKARRTG